MYSFPPHDTIVVSSIMAVPCPPDNIRTDLGCIPTDPIPFVGKVYGIGLSFIGLIAFVFMIIGGYYLLSSQGNPERVAKGKSFIYYAIAGVLLAVFGFVIVEVVGGDVLRIPGIGS